MTIKKGTIFYYFNAKNGHINFAKTIAEKDYEGPYGLAVSLKLIEVYSQFVGLGFDISVGKVVSANQFSGVGALGFRHYFFTSHQLIKNIFTNNNLFEKN